MLTLTNCDIYTECGVVSDKCLVIDGVKIVGLCDPNAIPPGSEVIDLKGNNVAAGFIDLQINGGGGRLLNDEPTVEAVKEIAAAHRKYGVTSLLPTLITASVQTMNRAILAVRESITNECVGVLGIHLEGPYLNPEKAGVHDKTQTRIATDEELDNFIQLGDGVIRLITVAPEQVTPSQVQRIVSRGIRVALGHTNASYENAKNAIEAGATCVTHLFNAMSQLGSREPGVVGAAMCEHSVVASVIADGFHVAWPTLVAAKKAMRDRLFLVTDAMPVVGTQSAQFQLGQFSISRVDDKLTTPDGVLAGSCLDMASAVRNCVQKAGIPLPEALRMASLYPARFLGIDDTIGSVAADKMADLVIFDNQVMVLGTIKCGVPGFTLL